MSNINNIFTLLSNPVNLEEDTNMKKILINEAVENEFIQEKFRFCKGFETAAKTATTNSTTITSI